MKAEYTTLQADCSNAVAGKLLVRTCANHSGVVYLGRGIVSRLFHTPVQVEGYSLYLDGPSVNRSVVGVPAVLGRAPSMMMHGKGFRGFGKILQEEHSLQGSRLY